MRERIKYFDYLRVISAFGVIVLHVAAQHWYTTGITTQEWKIFNGYQSLVRWTVPVFVMISGAVFLQKVLTIRVLWKKYIPKIIGAFVIWSAIYAILLLNDGGTFRETAVMFFVGKYHLWYIFMIVGLYAVVPILKDIADDRNKCIYFLGVAFIMTCLIPTIIDLSDIYVGTISHIVGKIYNNMNMPVLGIFAFYFVLGYWLHKIDISAKIRKILYALSILGGGVHLCCIICNFNQLQVCIQCGIREL